MFVRTALMSVPVLALCAVMVLASETPEPAEAPEITVEMPEPEGLRILDAAGIDPAEFLWSARIVAVLADTPNDPAFIQQIRDIEARAGQLFERDVVVITDTDRRSDSALRRMLRPRGFMLAIIEKDGTVVQRRPAPRDAREIAAIIDRFPLRRQEILERLPSGR
jgi:hypothetical protein